MKQKRLLILVLALLLGLSVGEICFTTETTNAADKRTLNVWLYKSFAKGRNAIYEEQVRAFAKQKGIDVEVFFFTDAEYNIKVTSSLVAGNPPDVCELLKDGPGRFHGMGELADVSDIVNDVDKELHIIPTFLLGTKFEGKYYAVPKSNHPPMWFVRTDVLSQAGAKIPETWEDVYSAALKIRDKVKDIHAIGATYNRSTDADNIIFSCLYAYGASITAADGKTIVFNSPKTLAAVNMLAKLMEPGLQPPGVMAWGDADNNQGYMAGKLAMTQNSSSVYWGLLKQGGPVLENTKMLMMPGGPDGRATLGNALYLGIFKKCKEPELAKELIRYLMKTENHLAWLEESKGAEMDISEKGMSIPFFKSDPNIMNEAKSSEITRLLGWPGPTTRSVAEVVAGHVLPDMMVKIVVEKTPPSKAIEEATAAIKDIYAKFDYK